MTDHPEPTGQPQPQPDDDADDRREARTCRTCQVCRDHDWDADARRWDCRGPCPDEYNPDHDPDFGIRRH